MSVLFLLLFWIIHALPAEDIPLILPEFPYAHGEIHEVQGDASWYGGKFQGRLTANGEIFDTNKFTAAHRTLPFGTTVKVVNLQNKKEVEVRINDRGPFVDNRVIDLSRAAASTIDMIHLGTVPVQLIVLSLPKEPESYTIQISAFSQYDNAISLQKELRAQGLDVTIEEELSRGIYRVVLPEVITREVKSISTKLAEIGYPRVLIRPR